MDDEPKWKRTQLETERGGSGRWGGRPRTAVGLSGEGGSGAPGGAVQPRLAISHSDPAVEFALHCLFEPLVEENILKLSTKTVLDLEGRRGRKGRIADIVICEPDLHDVASAFSMTQSYYPRVVALVPAHVGSKYFWRFFRNGISLCLWKYGLNAVLRTVQASLEEAESVIVYDWTVERFFRTPKISNTRIETLTTKQRNLLRRLRFSDKTLLAEFDVSETKMETMKENLFESLEVTSLEEAINVAERAGVIQLSTEPDLTEGIFFQREVRSVVSSWLERKLQQTDS